MDIETQDYKGSCRREGPKLVLEKKEKWRILVPVIWAIVSTFVFLLVTGSVAWTRMNGKLEVHDEKIKKVEETPTDIKLMKQEVGHLRVEFTDFRTEQKTWNGNMDIQMDEQGDKLDKILNAINGR